MVRQGGDKTLTLDMKLDLDVPKQTGKMFPRHSSFQVSRKIPSQITPYCNVTYNPMLDTLVNAKKNHEEPQLQPNQTDVEDSLRLGQVFDDFVGHIAGNAKDHERLLGQTPALGLFDGAVGD